MRNYKNKGPRKKRSAVWKHFNLVKLNDKKVTCTLCEAVVSFAGNTTQMWEHLEFGDNKHQEVFATLKPSPRRKRISTCLDGTL